MSLNTKLILNCESASDIGQMERLFAPDPLVAREDPLRGLSADRIPL
jgi:hypothetical protein